MSYPPQTCFKPQLTVRKPIINPVLSPTLLQIYCIGLIGLIPQFFWVWATICDPTNWRNLWEELVLVRIITVMAGSGPHQTSPHHAESTNVHQQGELHDLECRNDTDNQQEDSLQALHTGGSGYRRRSHLVHEQADEKDLQREIDDLKKKLRRA